MCRQLGKLPGGLKLRTLLLPLRELMSLLPSPLPPPCLGGTVTTPRQRGELPREPVALQEMIVQVSTTCCFPEPGVRGQGGAQWVSGAEGSRERGLWGPPECRRL